MVACSECGSPCLLETPSQTPEVCLFYPGLHTFGHNRQQVPMPAAPLGVMVESRRESVGVGPRADRPVSCRAAWDDTIQSDCHPPWEVELWPNALRLTL